jgi:hypothetical protein
MEAMIWNNSVYGSASPLRADDSVLPIASLNDEFCLYKLVSTVSFFYFFFFFFYITTII